MILGYDINDLFSFGNLIYTALVGGLMWVLKDRFFQKQQLRAGNIDNEIKEAEQGLKEIELLRETINVYKDVNNDLKIDLAESKDIIKQQKVENKKIDELDAKVNDLFLKLAVEVEKSKLLIEENIELKEKCKSLEAHILKVENELKIYKKANK